ncbi:MAG TPA: ABC transporter permease [Acidimicrobiales bacterium]|nr:ABC transporter permease [Acidimicrobiales bacterium]
MEYLAYLLLGLGTGAVYAALALGLVMEHRVSGVVNFAHGAMAMYSAYVFVELRQSGDLVLPVVGLPGRFHILDRAPLLVALAIALLAAAGLGLLVYALVIRPLEESSPLARVIACTGVMVTLQAIVVLRFGTENRSVATVLPARPVHMAGQVVRSDNLYLAAIVVLAAVALWFLYRFTRFGLWSRAVAENRTAASLLGCRVTWVSAGTWALATMLGGLLGILVAPITGLNPATYTLLVVPALAAALVGRLSSFGVTVTAALTLGMAQSEIGKLQDRFDWSPSVGLREGLPLVIIIVVLAFAGRSIRERQPAVQPRLPAAGRPRRVGVAVAVWVPLTALALVLLGSQERLGLITSLVGAVICLSLVVLTGYVGQISLAQMAFAGVAGFTLSKLAQDLGVPFPLAPLLAALVAGLTGLLLGLPAIRARGVNLAVVTVAGAVAIEELVFRNPALTGGFEGSKVPAPSLFGINLGIGGGSASAYPRVAFGLFVLAVLAAAALGVAWLRCAPLGRRLLAARANERAAAASGVDIARTKLFAFGLSAFIAGIGGSLLGYQQGRLSFGSFGVFVSLSFLAIAFLGGIARISGAMVGGALVAGGIVFTTIDELFGWGRYQLLVSGLGLVVIAVLYPDGLSGIGARLWRGARVKARSS